MICVCSAGEYVQEDGGTNFGSQFKNLGKLVENVNKEILNKVDAAGASSSSTNNTRYLFILVDHYPFYVFYTLYL